MSGLLPLPDRHNDFSSGIPFLSQTRSFQGGYRKSPGHFFFLNFKPCHVSLWGFVCQVLAPQMPSEPSMDLAELPSFSGRNMSTEQTELSDLGQRMWDSNVHFLVETLRQSVLQPPQRSWQSWQWKGGQLVGLLHIHPRAVVTWTPWNKQNTWFRGPVVQFRVSYFGIIRQV